MFIDDDPKENKVSPAAANMLLAGESLGPVKSAAPEKAAAKNAALEDLGVLYREHYRVIFGTAYRITGSASDAEDVLQTIFLRLTSSGSRPGLSPNPLGYLYRAAVNASLDLLRHRKRANAFSLDIMDLDKSSELLAGSSPEKDLVDKELRELLRQAIAKLEGRASTAFALRYLEGCDNRRIAEILGTSQLVVAVTLHRARTRLRKEIGNYLEKHHEAQ